MPNEPLRTEPLLILVSKSELLELLHKVAWICRQEAMNREDVKIFEKTFRVSIFEAPEASIALVGSENGLLESVWVQFKIDGSVVRYFNQETDNGRLLHMASAQAERIVRQ